VRGRGTSGFSPAPAHARQLRPGIRCRLTGATDPCCKCEGRADVGAATWCWSVGITANPYGVGASDASREKVTGRCSCCGLLHWYERWPDGSTGPYYERCVEHVQQPDEFETTTLARLRDHDPRLQRYADYAAQRATQYEREAKAEGGRQAARALRQRGDYQGRFAEVCVLHADRMVDARPASHASLAPPLICSNAHLEPQARVLSGPPLRATRTPAAGLGAVILERDGLVWIPLRNDEDHVCARSALPARQPVYRCYRAPGWRCSAQSDGRRTIMRAGRSPSAAGRRQCPLCVTLHAFTNR